VHNARPLARRCVGRPSERREGRNTAPRSSRETRAAPAGVLGVRVLEREPALAELTFDVVDLDAHQVHRAHRIDEAADALHVENEIAGTLVLLEIEAVLEARAAAADDGDAQSGALQVFALDRFL